MDIATLGLRIDASGMKTGGQQATQTLDNVTTAAGRAAKATDQQTAAMQRTATEMQQLRAIGQTAVDAFRRGEITS